MANKEKFDYFNSYIELAKKAIQEADMLIYIIENYSNIENMKSFLEKVHLIEQAGDSINHKVFKNIAKDFITPIDREDLMDLSCNLDNILDQIEDCIQHFYIYDVHKVHEGALEFAKLVKKSCEMLYECTAELKNYKKNRKRLTEYLVRVNDIEEEADLKYMGLIRKLYTEDNHNPMRVMIWSSIFEDMEECCDACEHASDVMRSVILKNS